MSQSNFITQQEALALIDDENTSFVDASWYLPAQKRDAKGEFNDARIKGAVYFDIDKISDPDTDLPHMLPSPEDFANAVGDLGIADGNNIIIYDGPGLFSAPRAWWTFKIMGAPNVRILQGGMDGWKQAGNPIETVEPQTPAPKTFTPNFAPNKVVSMDEVIKNTKSSEKLVLDARALPRFKGEAPEPRAGLRSGHIPGSKCLPFPNLMQDGALKDTVALRAVFSDLGVSDETQIITSCGSGVTASIITLALDEAGYDKHQLYDGSWSQWGLPDGPEVATDEG